jgi:hypothetical protein
VLLVVGSLFATVALIFISLPLYEIFSQRGKEARIAKLRSMLSNLFKRKQADDTGHTDAPVLINVTPVESSGRSHGVSSSRANVSMTANPVRERRRRRILGFRRSKGQDNNEKGDDIEVGLHK